MAKRRMISKELLCDDNFTDVEQSPRMLYIYLIVNADDDGMIRQTKNMCALSGASEEDLAVLIQKGYVYRFPTGTIVIMDWNVHNKVPPTRYTPTQFREEYACLEIDSSGRYLVHESPVHTQVREAEARADQENVAQPSADEESEGCAGAEPAGAQKEDNVSKVPSTCPYEAIVEAFRTDCPSYTAPRLISKKQKQKLDLLWNKFLCMDDIRAIFSKAESSDFLRTRFKGGCTFDWIITLENADKINMGNYSSSSQGSSGGSFDTDDFFAAALKRSYDAELVNEILGNQKRP